MVTDVGGARELILDDSYGTIIRSMASDEVVSALCRLFDDRKLLSLQSRNSRALVENRYNWDATAMDVEKAFLYLLSDTWLAFVRMKLIIKGFCSAFA